LFISKKETQAKKCKAYVSIVKRNKNINSWSDVDRDNKSISDTVELNFYPFKIENRKDKWHISSVSIYIETYVYSVSR